MAVFLYKFGATYYNTVFFISSHLTVKVICNFKLRCDLITILILVKQCYLFLYAIVEIVVAQGIVCGVIMTKKEDIFKKDMNIKVSKYNLSQELQKKML